MGWEIELRDGRLHASYGGISALEGLEVSGEDLKFSLEPYGRPYSVPSPEGEQVVHILRLVPEGPGPEDVLLEAFCGPRRLALRLYPRKPFKFELSGTVRWGREPYLCRTEPGRFGDVVQAALGPADSLLCDSIFDKWDDRLLKLSSWGKASLKALPDGRSFLVEVVLSTRFGTTPDLLAAEVAEHFISEGMSMPHYRPYDRTHHPLPPSGWCSWYCYGREITEEDMVANADWLAENLKPFGLEYVQLDDGYQGETWLDWNDRFPKGGKWLAGYIKGKGLKPGIWLLPQVVGKKDTKLLEEKPGWFLKRPDGSVFRAFGNYPYLDPTDPEVKREWFERTFATMVEWGIDYFKIDGEGEMHQWYALCRENLSDPSVTPDEAYRSWLEIIRREIGPERVLLICATQWRAMGYGDACRTGTDVGVDEEQFENALRATFSGYWMHTIAWYCDPDVLIVRPELPLERARAWASLLGLSGQVLMASDRMPELPEERVELLRRVFPAQDIRPMDLWPRRPERPYPRIWDLKVATSWGRWDVVGLFRWFEEDEPEVEITREKLGLPAGRYMLYDFWGKEFLGELGEGRKFSLEPGSCLVLCVRPFEGLPLLLGTSRHITQYPDLLDLRWDPGRGVLSGESFLVGRDPYEVRVLVEWNGEGYQPLGATADGADVEIQGEGPVLVLRLESDASRKVRWEVRLKPKSSDGTARR
ncbi:MAG: hypothetical protein DRP94_05515 [Candidatus Latescibacterota bacterium]|nr:MAG: hypothetical protein DRP94_05515 [Candidatus Latescibacterota bacterium]